MTKIAILPQEKDIIERIEDCVIIAEDEFETLAGIVYSGMKEFNLEGGKLIEFARQCIHRLLDAGALPFTGTWGNPPGFHPDGRWGTGREEITETIIADWQSRGGGELEWGAYPFAFVETYYPDGWPPKDA